MKDRKNINLPIQELAEGQLQKRLDYGLKKIFENIHDEKTDATAARTLTLKIKFTPDKNRENVAVESSVNTNLANVIGIATHVVTGRSEHTGQIQALELKSDIPGQTYFDDFGNVMNDVGEPIGKPHIH